MWSSFQHWLSGSTDLGAAAHWYLDHTVRVLQRLM